MTVPRRRMVMLFFRVPWQLRARLENAAGKEGLSLSEWLRQVLSRVVKLSER